jgi:NAD(P)-dependent dehydrogenase (short-subunit alcohol dehydrogenase family)
MTASIPAYAPLVERVARGEGLPRAVRQDHGVGMPEDCAALVVFLASPAAAHISGQCIGIGGDRLALWSHPAELVVELREGGWSAEQIAQRWPAAFAPAQQTYGIDFSDVDLDAP